MIKKTITFNDFNGTPATETLHFNLTTTDLIDILEIGPRLQKWQDQVAASGLENLSVEQTREFFYIFKLLIDAAYGKRVSDGKGFDKSPEVLKEFKMSAAYDAFLMHMFSHPQEANAFMENVMPKDLDKLVAEAQKVKDETPTDVQLPADDGVLDISTGGKMNTAVEEVPAWIREDRDPTKAELRTMTPAQMQDAFARKLAKDALA